MLSSGGQRPPLIPLCPPGLARTWSWWTLIRYSPCHFAQNLLYLPPCFIGSPRISPAWPALPSSRPLPRFSPRIPVCCICSAGHFGGRSTAPQSVSLPSPPTRSKPPPSTPTPPPGPGHFRLMGQGGGGARVFVFLWASLLFSKQSVCVCVGRCCHSAAPSWSSQGLCGARCRADSGQEDAQWMGSWWRPQCSFPPSGPMQPSQVPFSEGGDPGREGQPATFAGPGVAGTS